MNLPAQWRVAGRRRKGERARDLKVTLYDGGWEVSLGIVREGDPKASAAMVLDADAVHELLHVLGQAADAIAANQQAAA